MTTHVRPFAVTVIGAGNIGSHVIPLIGRLQGLGRVTVIDPDRYEPGNLGAQDVSARDVGRRKVDVQAGRLRGIHPGLVVEPLPSRVEDVPLGRLRADVLLACLDSRAARQCVNEAAWRLGVPWIDAGVDGGALMARVTVYVPGRDRPCLECGWGDADYRALEQAYACHAGSAAPSPTDAPACLGALAASLQASECRRALMGRGDGPPPVREVVYDLAAHQFYMSSLRRNPRCRFDHETWTIRAAPQGLGRTPLSVVLPRTARSNGRASLAVAGRLFVRQPACPECGGQRLAHWRLWSRGSRPATACVRCARPIAGGIEVAERLETSALSPREGVRTLGAIGLRQGDVLSIRGPSGIEFLECGGRDGKRVPGAWRPRRVRA